MKAVIKKLTSRKLWLSLAGVATGVALALGADASDVQAVSGAVTALVSAVVYIIVEGKVDAESVAHALRSVQDGIAAVEENAE